MSDQTGFNGWSGWNAWNVSLWLNNDYTFYHQVILDIKQNPDLNVCVAKVQAWLPAQTPDGAEYDFLSIREAISDDHAEYWDEE